MDTLLDKQHDGLQQTIYQLCIESNLVQDNRPRRVWWMVGIMFLSYFLLVRSLYLI